MRRVPNVLADVANSFRLPPPRPLSLYLFFFLRMSSQALFVGSSDGGSARFSREGPGHGLDKFLRIFRPRFEFCVTDLAPNH